jgi:argininosuccinate lyase
MDRLRQIVFGPESDGAVDAELPLATEIDRAHLVMLTEAGIVPQPQACAILREISHLRAADFAPLRGCSAPRGLYILYENYLINKLGAGTGGILQTARSRNDLKATLLYMRLRQPVHNLLRETLRLQAVLLRRARRFADVTMPAYTHYQAALPITYGHYLAGIASALDRHINALMRHTDDLAQCPLGAGAIGGTSFPIDTARTAALLGFRKSVRNSIDAVASRDVVLRLLAECGILGILLSRAATDLLQWMTQEFSFLDLPDALVGRSSMMPQKRNPFFLEHVQGRHTTAIGGFVAAAAAMQAKPFTNSISVGTEAVDHIWKALEHVSESLVLLRTVIAAARPRPGNMCDRAVQGYTEATELAKRLVTGKGLPFRTAYDMVGDLVKRAHSAHEPLAAVAAASFGRASELCAGLQPQSIARASRYGGGPGATMECVLELHSLWTGHMKCNAQQARDWRRAGVLLHEAVQHLMNAAQTQRSLPVELLISKP